ncbi:MAG: hypothetical protein ACI9SQ_000460, partial [Rubritalea sp.]
DLELDLRISTSEKWFINHQFKELMIKN